MSQLKPNMQACIYIQLCPSDKLIYAASRVPVQYIQPSHNLLHRQICEETSAARFLHLAKLMTCHYY